MTKERGFSLARKASLNSDAMPHKLGAVAIYNNHVLAVGWNSEKTSSLQARYNCERGFDGYAFKSSIHAEMMVISKIRYLDIDFKNVKLFIWRGKHEPRLAKPCAACEKALRDLGIRHVFYTGHNSYVEETYKLD